MLEEANDGDLFEGVEPSVVAECLDEFKNFYTSRCICLPVLLSVVSSRRAWGVGAAGIKALLRCDFVEKDCLDGTHGSV